MASAAALPLLARLLGPASLGIYSIVFATAQTGQTISTLGAEVVMQRNGAQHKSLGAEAVGRLFGVGISIICVASFVCGALVWFFRAFLADHWLGQPNLARWLGAAALLIVLQPLGWVPLIFLASLQEFRAYALRSALGVVFGSAVTVVLAWKYGVKGAVLGMLAAALAQILWSYVIVRPSLRALSIRLRFDHFWQETRAILRLGFPYYYGNTLIGTVIALPVMGLIGRYGGLSELGYLRVAQSMAAIIGFIPAAIAPAALSYLSASLADDLGAYQRLRIVHLRSVWTILLVLTVPVCLLLPWIIKVLFGAGYAQALRLAWISLWLSVLIGVIAVLVQYLLVLGQTVRIAWICTLSNGAFLGASLFLVPRYHALGFLIAQLIGQIVSLPFVSVRAIADLSSPELRLIRNLTLATFVSFGWTFVVSGLGLSSIVLVLLAALTLVPLSAFLFLKVLSPPERVSLVKLVTFRTSYA